MTEKALEGLRVVELGEYVSASFCAKLLGDLGAEVIKVEDPREPDLARRNGPFPGDVPHPERSGLFLFLNANKKGITLNLRTTTGREMLQRLLGDADVLVENHPPALLEDLGMDYSSVEERCPRLIYTALTPYGSSGPYKNYQGSDLNVQAAGGVSIGVGEADREPLAVPFSQADYLTGLAAAASTLFAVLARDVTGKGQLVDVAGTQVLTTLISFIYFLPNFIYRGITGTRKGRRGGEAYFPNTIMPCKDGEVCLYPLRLEQYLRFMDLIGNPEWQSEPRYRNRRAMAEEYPDEAEALIAPWFLERTKEEIFRICMEHRVPCVPVRTLKEVVEDPHLEERQFFVEVEHPVAGRLKQPGTPFRMSKTPGQIAAPAPTLGQHNEEVYSARLGLSQEELVRLRMAGVV